MHTTAIEIWVYGVLMILGGIIGFVRVHSKASLLSGVGLGLGLLACGYGVWRGATNSAGDSLVVAVVIAALLLVLFAIRFAKTRRFMPAGMLAILSLLAVVIFGVALKK